MPQPSTSATINLASQPFGRERARLVGLSAVCGLLTLFLAVLAGLIIYDRVDSSTLHRSIDASRKTLSHLQAEQARYSSVLSRPENADIFSRSVLLNEAIARRGVSWTRVFQDLGSIMPYDVRLASVRLPQAPSSEQGGSNQIQLDMVVGTERPEAISGMFSRLKNSKLFGAATMVSQAPPTQNDPLYRFHVRVAYAQKL